MGEDGKVADTAAALKTIQLSVRRRRSTEQPPKKPRRTLSQLGSGFSASLEDYRHCIGLSNNNLLPCCRQECPAYPKDLQPLDLWLRPVMVVEFLMILPFFDVPGEESLPPEPPPPNPLNTERILG